MTKGELKRLDAMLAAYQRYLDKKYTLSPAYELAIKLRASIEHEINAK